MTARMQALATPITSMPTAVWMARASVGAYLDSSTAFAEAVDAAPTDRVRAFQGGDTEGYFYETEGAMVLAFRGSQALGDWIGHANIEPTAFALDLGAKGRVHGGFRTALEQVWPAVAAALDEAQATGRGVWFTGHSLGGALAVMAAYRWAASTGHTPHGIVTFGQPRIGDATFASEVEASVGPQITRFINQGDPVPWLMRTLKFAHSGRCVYFPQDEEPRWDVSYLEAMVRMAFGALDMKSEDLLSVIPHHKTTYLKRMEAHAHFCLTR
jgi:triacylglycerol lipase